MNYIFSFYRLKLLFQKDWTENKKMYLLALPASIIIIRAIYFMFTIDFDLALKSALRAKVHLHKDYDIWHSQNEQIFIKGWLLIGLIAITWRLSKLGNTKSLRDFLILPASAIEKLLFNLIWTFLLVFPIYMILFQIIDFVIINGYIEQVKKLNKTHLTDSLNYFNLGHFFKNHWQMFGWVSFFFISNFLRPFFYKSYTPNKGLVTLPYFLALLVFFNAERIIVSGFTNSEKLLTNLIAFGGLLPILVWLNWKMIKVKQV